MHKRLLALCLGASVAVSGCVPEWDEAPLTATGKAGDNSSGGSSSTSATACSASANQPGMTFNSQGGWSGGIPCEVGGVEITGEPPEGAVKDALRGIKKVTGEVRVYNGADLGKIMPALTSAGSLHFTGNSGSPGTIAIPNKITSVDQVIVTNSDAKAIVGGSGITRLGTPMLNGQPESQGGLEVTTCPNLIQFTAFANLTTVHSVRLNDLPGLTKIETFSKLKSAKSIQFSHLDGVNSIPSIPVETVADAIDVQYCATLHTIAGFPKVAKLNRLNIAYNSVLTTVSFPALTEVAYLTLANNKLLPGIPFANLQVTTTYQICVPDMSCAEWTTWVADHAATATYNKCLPVSDQCSGA